MDSIGLDATKPQDRVFHLVVPGSVPDPTVIPARCIHGHQQLRRTPGQQLVPQRGIGTVFVGESWQKCSVNKPLEQGWHRAPPIRIDKNEVFGPGDFVLNLEQVWLQKLFCAIAQVKNWVEVEVTQIDTTHLVAGCACTGFIRVCQRMAKAVARWVPLNDENSFHETNGNIKGGSDRITP